MIQRIFNAEQLGDLPENGIEAQKIRALLNAYGCNYDFLEFYRQGGSFLACLDGEVVISDSPDCDYEELAEFLNAHGFSGVFCGEAAAEALKKRLHAEFTRVNLMEKNGGNSGAFPEEISPSEAWKIIGSRFEIPFEPWYLDISHRVRHGITRCLSDGKAALVVQHKLNGEVLLSQVAVLKEYERQGFAKRLVMRTAAAFPGEIQIVCGDNLTGFYESCGFKFKEYKYTAKK